MQETNITKSPYRAGLGIALNLALYLSGFFVILTPMPFIYAVLKQGLGALKRVGLISFGVVCLLYFFAVPHLYSFYQVHPYLAWLLPVPGINLYHFLGHGAVIVFGLSYYLFFVGVGIVVGHWLGSPLPTFSRIIKAAIVFFVAAVLIYAAYTAFHGLSFMGLIRDYFHAAFNDFLKLQQDGGTGAGELVFLKENLAGLIHYSILFSPAILFCGILLVFVLNLILSKKLFGPFLIHSSLRLTHLVVPFYGVWITIACLSLILVKQYFPVPDFFHVPAVNIFVVLLFIYFLQGTSIVAYYLETRGTGPMGRILVYSLLILFFQVVGPLVIALGFFDAWLNFRKMIHPPQIPGI